MLTVKAINIQELDGKQDMTRQFERWGTILRDKKNQKDAAQKQMVLVSRSHDERDQKARHTKNLDELVTDRHIAISLYPQHMECKHNQNYRRRHPFRGNMR